MKKYLVILVLSTFLNDAFSQNNIYPVTGRVISETGIPIPAATIMVKNTKHTIKTENDGRFTLNLSPGGHVFTISSVGYESKTISIDVNPGQANDFLLKLKTRDGTLNEVLVKAKAPIENVRESPFNVVALDAKALQNTTLDLGHMLNRASGIRIRENGGGGSNMSVSLDGFSGRHVKLFMDGVPMGGFGSAFQLNNIPVGIADRIEIYKGVVPVEFGGDAMGGVINVVTKKTNRSYLDASYSFGSFNTHRTSIDAGYVSKKGFTAQITAYQNYSDNSYKVYTQILNLETSTYSRDSQWVRRFHDTYHNETLIAKAGFLKKWWADRFLIGATLGKEYADIQQANLMRIVYGNRFREGNTFMPSLVYSKKDFLAKGLHFNLTGNYNINFNKNVDTARRQYNWRGEYRTKSGQGEGLAAMSEYVNRNASGVANLTYRLKEKHDFSLNNTFTTFWRRMTDKAIAVDGSVSASDTMRRIQSKNILAASYRYKHSLRWQTNVFAKYYVQSVTGPVDTSSKQGTVLYAEKTTDYRTTGYGAAATYVAGKDWQLKASYEQTYRLPTEAELFGDGVLEKGSAAIRAEFSRNYNLSLTYNGELTETHGLFADVSFIYRDINDYIRREVNDQRYGSAYYFNHGKISNTGINAEAKYFYKDFLSVGANVTYQNLRNKEKFRANSTVRSLIYNDRVPNVPFFFGNTDIGLTFKNLFDEGDMLSASHQLFYTHEFFLDWPSLASVNTKDRLPKQISNDFLLTYIMKGGKYNISVEARNFTNSLLYDNFSLQKPGRSFFIKLRYYISKSFNQ